jgi:hypothetical protein
VDYGISGRNFYIEVLQGERLVFGTTATAARERERERELYGCHGVFTV